MRKKEFETLFFGRKFPNDSHSGWSRKVCQILLAKTEPHFFVFYSIFFSDRYRPSRPSQYQPNFISGLHNSFMMELPLWNCFKLKINTDIHIKILLYETKGKNWPLNEHSAWILSRIILPVTSPPAFSSVGDFSLPLNILPSSSTSFNFKAKFLANKTRSSLASKSLTSSIAVVRTALTGDSRLSMNAL